MSAPHHSAPVPESPGREYLSPAEFARKSGLSLATVRRYLKKGRLPFAQPDGKGGRVLIPADALTRPRTADGAANAASGSAPPADTPAPAEPAARPPRRPGPKPGWQRQARRR